MFYKNPLVYAGFRN